MKFIQNVNISKMYGLEATASGYNQIDGEIFQVLKAILINI